MKKILIVMLHLNYGGVEKAVSDLSNELIDNHEVELLVVYKMSDKPAFNLDKRIKVTYLTNLKPNRLELNCAIKKFNLFKLFKELKLAIKILYLRKKRVKEYILNYHFDVVISTRMLFHDIIIKNCDINTLTIAQEHTYCIHNNRYLCRLKKRVKNFSYFMPVSKEMTNFFEDFFKNELVKVKYIPLMIDSIPKMLTKKDLRKLVVVSRLSPEKSVLDSVKVLEEIIKIDPSFTLDIFGDGIDYVLIKEYINSKKLNDNIIMHGFKNRDIINKKLNSCSMCLMTSYEESFGLVLIEGMAYGVVPIAFDDARGAVEVISDKYGYLISNRDIKKMALRIIDVAKKIELEEKRKICFDYIQFFSRENVKVLWNKLLNDEFLNEKGRKK